MRNRQSQKMYVTQRNGRKLWAWRPTTCHHRDVDVSEYQGWINSIHFNVLKKDIYIIQIMVASKIYKETFVTTYR